MNRQMMHGLEADSDCGLGGRREWERNPGVAGEGWRGRTLTWADVAAAAPGWPGGLREDLVTKLPGEGALALRSPVSRCSAPELLRP